MSLKKLVAVITLTHTQVKFQQIRMAGGKREQRREKMAAKQASQPKDEADGEGESKVVSLPAEEFYEKMDETMNKVPRMGQAMDGILRNMIRGTVLSWTRRFGAITSLRRKTLVWLQLLLADEQKTAQVKLYALGSRVALNDDDSKVLEGSRTLFKDAAPFFMEDYGLWIFSRSLVRKSYNGVIDDALDFASYDPLDSLSEMPLEASSGVRCAEMFLFFAVDPDVPGDDLSSREAVMAFLEALNSEDGNHKIHAFTVVAGSVVAEREKLRGIRGNHLTA